MADPATTTLIHDGNGAVLSGVLDAQGAAQVWQACERLASGAGSEGLSLDASGVTALDGAGAALLARMDQLVSVSGGKLDVRGLSAEQAALVAMYREQAPWERFDKEPPQPDFIAETGRKALAVAAHVHEFVTFIGHVAAGLGAAVRNPRIVRWKDALRVAEDAGVNGLPIIVLIGFLMGLILAFQSAIPLERFGAELYVADLLGISMIREMAALVTAILLTGRSGSAFAAEIGTMKVNEEIDALKTMGLSPVQFLALPRIIAALAVMPALTAFFCLFAFIGGAVVVTGFGYPLVTYLSRLVALVSLGDLAGGLFKAMVFSLIVAGVGCQKGLSTGTGAQAVGSSTTSAVVAGLVLIAVADGIFAALFFALGI